MKPLEITVELAGDVGEILNAIRINSARNLQTISPVPCRHDGTIVLAGSGPSLAHHLDELRGHQAKGRPIIAIKGAHDYLISHNITPDMWVCLDPRDKRDGIQRKNKHTTYLLASRCHPVMFEHLSDCKVMLWHSWSQEAELPALGDKWCIGGGTTSGLRAVNIGYVLGFRKFVMYGYDSCVSGDTLRVDGSKGDRLLNVYVGESGRKFVTTPEMAQQAKEFQRIYEIMPDVDIVSRGDGLITAIIAERQMMMAA
jgi:uncharacterized Rossmann fold enzyme